MAVERNFGQKRNRKEQTRNLKKSAQHYLWIYAVILEKTRKIKFCFCGSISSDFIVKTKKSLLRSAVKNVVFSLEVDSTCYGTPSRRMGLLKDPDPGYFVPLSTAHQLTKQINIGTTQLVV